MKILPNTNELLRAAESALTNEQRLAAYEERKLRYGAGIASEPHWWTYEDNDSEWIREKTDNAG